MLKPQVHRLRAGAWHLRISWGCLLGLPLVFLLDFHLLDINLTNNMPADDLPRLIHHLGPRYTGTFQDLELVKFPNIRSFDLAQHVPLLRSAA